MSLPPEYGKILKKLEGRINGRFLKIKSIPSINQKNKIPDKENISSRSRFPKGFSENKRSNKNTGRGDKKLFQQIKIFTTIQRGVGKFQKEIREMFNAYFKMVEGKTGVAQREARIGQREAQMAQSEKGILELVDKKVSQGIKNNTPNKQKFNPSSPSIKTRQEKISKSFKPKIQTEEIKQFPKRYKELGKVKTIKQYKELLIKLKQKSLNN